MNYINSHIKIENNKVWLNSELIFEIEENISFGKFTKAAYKHLGMKYMKFFKMDEMSKLGLLATEFILREHFNIKENKAEEIGQIMANKNASLLTDTKYFETIRSKENYFPSPALFVYTLPNTVMGEIAIKNNFKGENIFFIQKEFTANQYFHHAEYLLNRNSQKAFFCAWNEANSNSYKLQMYLVEQKKTNLAIEHSEKNIIEIIKK